MKKTVFEHIRDRLLRKVCTGETFEDHHKKRWHTESLEEYWSKGGVKLPDLYKKSRSRMGMGGLRYGGKLEIYYEVNALKKSILYIKRYEKTGNLENLCDALNYAMIGYRYPWLESYDIEDYKFDCGLAISLVHSYWKKPMRNSYFESEDDKHHIGAYGGD